MRLLLLLIALMAAARPHSRPLDWRWQPFRLLHCYPENLSSSSRHPGAGRRYPSGFT